MDLQDVTQTGANPTPALEDNVTKVTEWGICTLLRGEQFGDQQVQFPTQHQSLHDSRGKDGRW